MPSISRACWRVMAVISTPPSMRATSSTRPPSSSSTTRLRTWPSWLLYALAAVAGVTVSSWNGVQIAEIARRSPSGLIREAASGATIVVFLGYVVGPSSFALLVAATGRFDLGFLVCAAAGLAGFLLLATKRGA